MLCVKVKGLISGILPAELRPVGTSANGSGPLPQSFPTEPTAEIYPKGAGRDFQSRVTGVGAYRASGLGGSRQDRTFSRSEHEPSIILSRREK
jgi:hypothetical protein